MEIKGSELISLEGEFLAFDVSIKKIRAGIRHKKKNFATCLSILF
jgi:hypothetical protein